VQRKVHGHGLGTLFGLACLAGVDEGDQRPEHGGVGDGEVVGLGGADNGPVDGVGPKRPIIPKKAGDG
jgi:hypothetical protein